MVNGFQAKNLEQALQIRNKESVVPYGGGTDLMVEPDDQACYLFLSKVPELKKITEDENYIRIGAACTFTELMEHTLTPAMLTDAISEIAAPAIRNLGTVGGNICNGSPKADSALIFFVTDANLRLMSVEGERILPIKDFYQGRNKTALTNNELLVEILMPKKKMTNYYYKKIGARKALAISRVSFAALMDIQEGKIQHCATAYGAVSDVVIRLNELDAMLIGKTIEQAKEIKSDYLNAYERAIVPIRGRVSSEYRKTVCLNLLKDFLKANGI